jgi:uncharacterized protein YggU (UPF0235/DUF167 family)
MRITVTVKTGVKSNIGITQTGESTYTVRTNAKPIDGEANKSVTKLLSNHFNISKSHIKIVSGESSKIKIVEF